MSNIGCKIVVWVGLRAALTALDIDTSSVCAINTISAKPFALSKENVMRLTPPKQITFWIAVVLAVLGLLSFIGTLTILPIEAFWLVMIAFVLLAVALMVKDL
jgi:hypothetical protein